MEAFMGGHDPFADFMGGGFGGGFGDMGGFGNMGGGMSFQSSSFGSGMGGGGMQGSSKRTQSYMENGKQITRTEETTVDRNGQ